MGRDDMKVHTHCMIPLIATLQQEVEGLNVILDNRQAVVTEMSEEIKALKALIVNTRSALGRVSNAVYAGQPPEVKS